VAGQTCVLLPFSPSAGIDAYIKQEKQDEKRGGDPELRVKTESGKLMRSLLKFDLSSIPSTAIVNSATLSLYVKDANSPPALRLASQLISVRPRKKGESAPKRQAASGGNSR
jgi:hypothetical protein